MSQAAPAEYLVVLVFDVIQQQSVPAQVDEQHPRPPDWVPVSMTIGLNKALKLAQPVIVEAAAPYYLQLIKRSSGRLAMKTTNDRFQGHMSRLTQVRLYARNDTTEHKSGERDQYLLMGASLVDEDRLYTKWQAVKVAAKFFGGSEASVLDRIGDMPLMHDDKDVVSRKLAVDAKQAEEWRQKFYSAEAASVRYTMQLDGLKFPSVFARPATLLLRGVFSHAGWRTRPGRYGRRS